MRGETLPGTDNSTNTPDQIILHGYGLFLCVL